eukprot:18616-Prymnesium_polylepis.1
MLDEMIDWVETGVDKLTEQFPDEVTDDPCLDSVVLDGDASTSALTCQSSWRRPPKSRPLPA